MGGERRCAQPAVSGQLFSFNLYFLDELPWLRMLRVLFFGFFLFLVSFYLDNLKYNGKLVIELICVSMSLFLVNWAKSLDFI